jgi:hypothetical protein
MMSVLRTRWVVVPTVLAVLILIWNIYVVLHNHGVIEGRVVDAHGAAVPGAKVTLLEQNVTTYTERSHTTTDADGRFVFRDNRSHHVKLVAEKEGAGQSPRRDLRLWFRAQDRVLATPLELQPQGSAS